MELGVEAGLIELAELDKVVVDVEDPPGSLKFAEVVEVVEVAGVV